MSGGEPSSIKRIPLCAAVNLRIRIPVRISAFVLSISGRDLKSRAFSEVTFSVYRALYRKYRPRDFSDVCGQPHIVRTLKNQLKEGRLSHAYLFTGSRGTGKTSCAKIFAKAVNCLRPVDGDPCTECEICRGIDDETVLDVTEIDAASNNGVDDIRELRDNSAFAPVAAKYRVYIVDEVHMLSGAAFNALLKTLEEPPEHIIFILATTEVHKLPATILSRCQRFDFRRISPEDIASRLEFVASKENFTLTHDAALLIGRLSDGAMRDALSLLDVCSAASDNIDEQVVLDSAGLSGRQYLGDLIHACVGGDAAAALGIVDELYRKAKDLGRLCSELVEYLRDIMLIKTLRRPEDMLKCSAGELDEMRAVADSVKLDAVMHAISVFEGAGEAMRSGAARRTAVETAVIKLCDPSLDTSSDALLRRISLLEGSAPRAPFAPQTESAPAVSAAPPAPAAYAHSAPAAPPAPTEPKREAPPAPRDEFVPAAPPTDERAQAPAEPAPSAAAEPAPSAAASAPADGAQSAPASDEPEGEFTRWGEVLDSLGQRDPLMRAALGGSRAFIRDGFMLLDFANHSFRDMINDQHHRANLKQAIAAVTGKSYPIGPYTPAKQPAKKQENDPLDKLIENAAANGLGEEI